MSIEGPWFGTFMIIGPVALKENKLFWEFSSVLRIAKKEVKGWGATFRTELKGFETTPNPLNLLPWPCATPYVEAARHTMVANYRRMYFHLFHKINLLIKVCTI